MQKEAQLPLSRQAHILSFDDAKRNRARRGAPSSARKHENAHSSGQGRRSGRTREVDIPRGADLSQASNNPRSYAAAYRSQSAAARRTSEAYAASRSYGAGHRGGASYADGMSFAVERSDRSSSATLFADEDFYASLNFADSFGSAGGNRGSESPFADSSRASSRSDRASRVSADLEARFGGSDEDEFDIEEANRKLNPISRMKMRFGKAKRSAAKAKAGKEFARRYGDSGPSDASAGPRAAVYKGEMGSQHRRAARMQGEAGAGQGSTGSMKASRPKRKIVSSRWFIASCGIAACLAFCCMFLYTPAQQYYQEMRERDRLALEYQAVVDRNDQLEQSVNYLSTDAGVEDQARADFGWIREGERAVSVSGLTVDEELNFTANILSSDIKPPHTWYSAFLDPIFGVS